ncbi:MAG: DNA replication/repair protein RecF [bacterium]|nr:DNA replication/repair protein RecF [bacterium]
MHITRVKLVNFRNIADLEFSPEPSVNLIGGPNGAGKTSIIEAIFFGCTARSFRSASDEVLLRKGADVCRIEIDGVVNERETTVEIAWGRAHKRQIKVDGIKLTRVADLFDYFHAVSYIPEDTELVYGAPSVRRHLLDLYLSQADRSYLNDLFEYNRILAQRNSLLKEFEIGEDSPTDYEMLDVWDGQLAGVGARINAKRIGMIADSAEQLALYYRTIEAGDSILSWKYESSINDDPSSATAFQQKLVSSRRRDLYMGSTSAGPHRDDVSINLNSEPMRGYASQGEAKSAALAIKFAIYGFLTKRLHGAPILLLDEISSDLDPNRLASLMSTLPKLGQVFLTTAKPAELRETASIQAEIAVVAGKLQ